MKDKIELDASQSCYTCTHSTICRINYEISRVTREFHLYIKDGPHIGWIAIVAAIGNYCKCWVVDNEPERYLSHEQIEAIEKAARHA